MRTLLLIAFAFSLAFFVTLSPASASQPGSAHHDRCLEEAATQLAMNDCADQERQLADKEVARLFVRVASGSRDRNKFARAQRRWAHARETRCRKEAALHEGGSILPLVYASCLSSVAHERIHALKAALATPAPGAPSSPR